MAKEEGGTGTGLACLPACSPNLFPLENMWRKMNKNAKNNLVRVPTTRRV